MQKYNLRRTYKSRHKYPKFFPWSSYYTETFRGSTINFFKNSIFLGHPKSDIYNQRTKVSTSIEYAFTLDTIYIYSPNGEDYSYAYIVYSGVFSYVVK